MRYVISMIIMIMMIGCSGREMADRINGAMVYASGNRPPSAFRVANADVMSKYIFNMENYKIGMPEGRAYDFIGKNAYGDKNGWFGFTSYDRDVSFILDPYYQIDVSTNECPQKVTKYERAILDNNLTYFKKFFRPGLFDKIYIRHYGKESYRCLVTEYRWKGKDYKNTKFIDYDCYKFNPSKTEYECVTISLTYSKPLDPKLARIFTYEDLKKRARRMLDSLYIKSLW